MKKQKTVNLDQVLQLQLQRKRAIEKLKMIKVVELMVKENELDLDRKDDYNYVLGLAKQLKTSYHKLKEGISGYCG